MDESEYLAQYDHHKYPQPFVTVDAVLFAFHEKALNCLLIKRTNHPEQNKWALPGGFVHPTEDASLEATAVRILKDKTGIRPPYLESLKAYGNATRDKRGWSVTTTYVALMAYRECAPTSNRVSEAQWINVEELDGMELAFDHAAIIRDALERLRQKALYSLIPVYALPAKFTLGELQHLHELLIGKPLQKKSFRRRVEQADLLNDTGETKIVGKRPAALYSVKKGAADYNFVRNIGM